MSNRFTLILGVVAGVILVLAINAAFAHRAAFAPRAAFAHRAHELRGAPDRDESAASAAAEAPAARLDGLRATFRDRIDGARAANQR
jgi:hypothetical protein